MAHRQSFDPKSLLAKVGEGHSVRKYRENEVVFSQGDLRMPCSYQERKGQGYGRIRTR